MRNAEDKTVYLRLNNPALHQSPEIRVYRVFLSSPGDVLPERDRAQAVIERLNAEYRGGSLFSLTRWEQSYYSATGPFQDQIPNSGEHDLVVFIFWKRLGTDLPAAYNRPDGTSRTGTEYEFEEARDARERRADQLPDILVYRKTAKVTFNEETVDVERAQKKALDQFWERWFRSDTGHFIAGFQSVSDAGDFEQQFERNLREWLRRRNIGHIVWNIATQGSPYRGLAPYEEDQSGLFYGRDADMARARARFIEAAVGQDSGRRGTTFLLILGASGAGKSSFLRAGLLPRMRDAGVPAFLEDGSDAIHAFRTLMLVPGEMGEDLCLGLARALYSPAVSGHRSDVGLARLADGDYQTPEAFAALAMSSPESALLPIVRALDRIGADAAGSDDAPGLRRRFGLLLAIDQMEELFTRPEADRQSFVRLLASLARNGRVWVAATMRNDFYDRLRQDTELSALVDRGRVYNIAPPNLADYRDIIRQPALASGLRFEATAHRDLAVEIENEAGSEGALPMIAFLLEQLFHERRGDLLTLEAYDRLGGAAGALGQRGDQVVAALPEPVQNAFPLVVRHLVRKSLQDLTATATSCPLSAFPEGSSNRQLIDALREARLVSAGGLSAANARVRWSHETLLTRWPRLRNSVDADRRDYETLDRLQSAHSLWNSTPAPNQSERLLTSLALAEAEDLVQRWGAEVDGPLRQFVDASRFHARARRRRRRRAITATVVSLSVLSIVATVAGIFAVRQRDLALQERTAADRTTRFMISLFALADPSENRGNTVTVREVLDRGAAEIEAGMEHEPAARADLLTAMGQAYSGLGLYDQAKDLLAKARADQEVSHVTDESRVHTLDASGSNLYLAADYQQAEKILLEAVALARNHLPADSVLRSEALDDLADVLVQLERYPEAAKLCRQALVADRTRGPGQAKVLAHTLDTLGSVYYNSGNLPAAEAAMREALDLHLKASGKRDALTAQAMSNLGSTLYQSGRYDEASDLYRQALPIYRDVYGPEHPEVAALLNNMGRSTLMAGHVDVAESVLRQALAMDDKLKGPNHDDLVPPLNSLAMIDGYSGRFPAAQAEIERAERIARLPNQGALLDQVLLNAADFELRGDRVQRAPALLAESRRLLQAAFPPQQQSTEAWRYAILDTVDAELIAHQGDAATARRKLASALPIIEKRFGPSGFQSLLAQRRVQFVETQATLSAGAR
jgi:tetratricopeptide (TPR) repeat protein